MTMTTGSAIFHKQGIAVVSQRISVWRNWLPVKLHHHHHRHFHNQFGKRLATWQMKCRGGASVAWQQCCGQHTKSTSPTPACLQSVKQKKGLVYASTSADTFANLAFEDWVHDHWDLSHLNLLFLWRNEPSIVIGRHQNPWTECNIRELLKTNVKLARRRSGGGTVYHDLGNVNCTFFTHRKTYNRQNNLQMIVDGMNEDWPLLDICISPRDDLMLNNFYKISGSAARLSRNIAYHHCTLLHSANTGVLASLLNFCADGVKSNATESIRSPVLNLREAEPRLSQQDVFQAIATEFYAKNPPYYNNQIYAMSPTDEQTWEGITQKKKELMEWDWIYGKTPKFQVEKKNGELSAIIHVNKGCIDGAIIHMPYDWVDSRLIQQLTGALKDVRFWITDVAMALNTFLNDVHVEVDEDVRGRLKTLCHLLEDCVS